MNCLLISYHFRNEGIPSAHHLMDRLPLLAEEGIKVRLVNSMAARRIHDLPQLRVPPILPGEVRYLLRFRLQRSGLPRTLRTVLWQAAFLPLFPLFLIERLLPFRDFTLSWCVPAAAAGVLTALRDRPDVLFSFGGRPCAHLAAAVVARLCDIPWVAQVQDPLVLEGFARNRFELRFQRALERLVMTRAHRVVFMTERAREAAEARTGAAGKGVTSYAGFDPGWFEGHEHRRGDRFRILHAGTLGGSRSVKPFLDAMAAAAVADPTLRGILRLELAGNLGEEAESQLRAFPFPEMVLRLGSLQRPELYRRMRAADALLLIQNSDPYSGEVINAKFYEYLFAGRPILGLVFDGNELSGLLRRWGHAAVDLEDGEGIARGLDGAIAAWRDGTTSTRIPEDAPTTRDSARRLASLLREAAGSRSCDGRSPRARCKEPGPARAEGRA